MKVLFYLPLRDLDGRNLAGEIAQLEQEIFVAFSGWSFQGYVKGAYAMADGSHAIDESAAYFVVLDEVRVDDLIDLVQDFKSKTLQEAIYFEVQRDVDVRFL